jgi:hypothetical protein
VVSQLIFEVRLATFLNTTAEFWMNLQKTYELRLAEISLPGKACSIHQLEKTSHKGHRTAQGCTCIDMITARHTHVEQKSDKISS